MVETKKRAKRKPDNPANGQAADCPYIAEALRPLAVPLSSLKLDPKNTRKHPEPNIEGIAASLRLYGQRKPIVVNKRTGHVEAGNGTLVAAKSLGWSHLAVVHVDDDATTAAGFSVVDNQTAILAEWDADNLSALLAELSTGDESVDKLLRELREQEFGGGESDGNGDMVEPLLGGGDVQIDSLGPLFQLKDDARFDGEDAYDFPIIRPDMILEQDHLSCYVGPTVTKAPPPYLWNYGTDSTSGLPWDQTVISFYTDDRRFEGLWANTSEVVSRFLNREIIGIVSPNFSTYFEWPRAVRIYNIFRSRWVARYCQEAGIRVIPDIACSPDDLDYAFNGLPIGSHFFIQCHRKLGPKEIDGKTRILEAVRDRLKPSKLWVYADESKLSDFPILAEMPTAFVVPRTILQHHHKEEMIRGEKEKLQKAQ